MHRQLVIVGAGPAGMSAAITATNTGLTPTIIDENPRVGGQIYRQPPATFEDDGGRAPVGIDGDAGNDLRRRFEELLPRMELLTGTTVWGLFPPKRLAIVDDQGVRTIEAEHLILAPGAYEYVPPFPGWTLPGVFTPGGAQSLVKTMKVLPGRRAIVAGTGPFLLVVALELHRAGVEVVCVVEAVSTLEVLNALPHLLVDFAQLRQGWRYLRELRRAGIPVRPGHIVSEARGVEEVGEVVVSRCDGQWNPVGSGQETIEVDTLCVGYGFVPRTQLAQLANCRLRFDDLRGGWCPQVDEHLQTSVAGIWSAGDGGGVAGAVVAELEGALVGLSAARALGTLDLGSFHEQRAELLPRLRKLGQFRAAMDGLCRVRSGLSHLASADTVVCRCEELTLTEVIDGVEVGGGDMRTLKVMTRLGMGPCQGRMCWPAMSRLVAARNGRTIEEIGPTSVRPPIKPVCLGSLASWTPGEFGKSNGSDEL